MSLPDYSYLNNNTGYNNDVANVSTTDFSSIDNSIVNIGNNLIKPISDIANIKGVIIDMNTGTDYAPRITPPSDDGFKSSDIHGVKQINPLVIPSDEYIPQMELPESYYPSDTGGNNNSGSSGSSGSSGGTKTSGSGSSGGSSGTKTSGSGSSGGSSGTKTSGSGSSSGATDDNSNKNSGISFWIYLFIFIIIIAFAIGSLLLYEQNKKKSFQMIKPKL